jgi:hypothetical protein
MKDVTSFPKEDPLQTPYLNKKLSGVSRGKYIIK